MNGGGVINYNADRPSYEYSTNTTEFDDALIKRGIVTTEQVMMAKGASAEEAIRLAEEKRRENNDGKYPQDREDDTLDAEKAENHNNLDGLDDDDDSDDDDEFFARYRKQRLEQLKREHNQSSAVTNTRIKEITRNEWMVEVNEASQTQWILVVLTDPSSRQRVLQEAHNLLRQKQNYDDEDENGTFSFRIIPATQAIDNWPTERVPAIFAYCHGLKQHEWIAASNGMFPSPIEPLLRQWKIQLS